MFLGALIGVSLHFIGADAGRRVIDWYSIVGNGYVNLLKLVAIPLIFISILSAINKLEHGAGLGRMSLTVVGCMLLLVMIGWKSLYAVIMLAALWWLLPGRRAIR